MSPQSAASPPYTPPHVLVALQNALCAHLLAQPAITAQIGKAVYKVAPRTANPPFITFTGARLRDKGGLEAPLLRVDLDLVVVTAERGKLDLGTLMAQCAQALATPPATLEGYRLILLEIADTRIDHARSTSNAFGRMHLTALLEPLV